jgi:glycerol-3-phosphate dehydrogenase
VVYDILIIGGGVVGSLIARQLSRYHLKILLVEKEADIGMGASSANSAIIHAGYDPIPGSLKALTNTAANPLWDELSAELGFAFDRRGDFVVAIGEQELPALENLLLQGKRNGVPGLEIISGEEMRRREPHINPQTSGALWAPSGGLCDPFAVTIAAAENAVQNGVQIMLETAFEDFIFEGRRIVGIKTNRGELRARWVVNAAGIHADEVMHSAGERLEFKITPRRGEYIILDRAEFNLENVLFPVPSAAGKGILVTATLHGNTILGPNAQLVDAKTDTETTAAGLEEIASGARKLVPSIDLRQAIATFAGLRAYGNAPCLASGVDYQHDFIIEIPEAVAGLVNLGGIESPGLTAAPAIANRVVDLLRDAGEELRPRRDWNPIRPPRPHFRELSRQEQAALIRRDPAYGRIICRCEMVTEGEVLAELQAPIPARTYDALKRRTWLGTGRCLGGFDMPRVVNLMAKELKISPFAISKKGHGSEFLIRRTKDSEVPDEY